MLTLVYQYQRRYGRETAEGGQRLRYVRADGEKDGDSDHAPHASAVLCEYKMGSELAAGDDQSGPWTQTFRYDDTVSECSG